MNVNRLFDIIISNILVSSSYALKWCLIFVTSNWKLNLNQQQHNEYQIFFLE